MIKRALVVALVSMTASISSICAEKVPPLSRVRIQVTDNYGRSVIEYARIIVTGPGITLDATGRAMLKLKQGDYIFVVNVPGINAFQRSVTIDQPEQVVSVGMRLGTIEGSKDPCSIKGRVSPIFDNIRIRLMSIYGMEIRDVPVVSGGVFRFDDLECGAYMLLATRNGECLGQTFPVVTEKPMHVLIPLQRTPKGGGLCSVPRLQAK